MCFAFYFTLFKRAVELFTQCVCFYEPEKLYSQNIYYYTYYKHSERHGNRAENYRRRAMVYKRQSNIFYQLIEHKRMGMYQIDAQSGGSYIIYDFSVRFPKLSFEKKINRKIADKTTNGEV